VPSALPSPMPRHVSRPESVNTDEASNKVSPPFASGIVPKLIAHFHNNTQWHVLLIVRKSSNQPIFMTYYPSFQNFQPPCLVSYSIMDIFSHPTQILSQRLCEWRLPVTFSAYHLLDCIESNSSGVVGGARPFSPRRTSTQLTQTA
jgi:hypothetical protein